MNDNSIYFANMKTGVIYALDKTLIPYVNKTLDNPDIRVLNTKDDIIQADFDIFFKKEGNKTLEELKSEYDDDDDLVFNILSSDVITIEEDDFDGTYCCGVKLDLIILNFSHQDAFHLIYINR